jgi:heat shock protein HslJ
MGARLPREPYGCSPPSELDPAARRLAAVPTTRLTAATLAALLFGLALAGCSDGAGGQGQTPPPPTAPALAGRTFLSVAVTDGAAAKPLVAGTRIRLAFTESEITASAGCNTMGGSYRVDGPHLIVDQLATTDMGCPAPLGAQDAWLATLLGAQPAFTVVGNDLALSSGSVAVMLRDRTVVEPDKPMVGPTWRVESIIAGDVVSTVPAGAAATLAFNADGTFTLFTGCNSGGGHWSAVTGGIQVTDVVTTKMACLGAGGSLETAVLAALRGRAINLSIDADSMTLQSGASGIQLRAG